MKIPVSTYRLQFNRDFRFADALPLVDYLHELGITDLYASPIFKARTGSTHGYDVTDPTQINPEIGAPEEFGRLCEALRAKNMGLILDIVPNHMAATAENAWWFDILEKGEDSTYAEFFDINWKAKPILLPILGKPYGEALEDHELVLTVENGRAILQYYGQRLPIAAGAEDLDTQSLDRILSRQHYRLAHWKKAAETINYRRFFDISDLVSLRVELDEVYAATHAFVLRLVQEGKVTGLRIDHIDGLRDPKEYLDRLPETYIAVEKILAGAEQLPADWHTHGTTGYDFLNFLNGALIDREGFRKLQQIYSDLTGSPKTFTQVFLERKRQVINELFPGELNALANRLHDLAESDRHARDIRMEDLKWALMAVSTLLPVYRTYVRGEHLSERDRAYIENAVSAAGKGAAFDFLRRVLLVQPAWYLQHQKADYLDFVMRWQQFTGPVMAKGLEDTAFYVHNPLISVNEVGGESSGPEMFFGVEEFHRRNLERNAQWPYTMNATSTHDTKRSEDVRARIDVLSEFPEEWSRCLRQWRRLHPTHTAPGPNEQVLIYQTMLGAWPIEPERLKQYVTKALREGKAHTSWLDINEDYERRVLSFVDSLYSDETFLKTFHRLEKKLAYFGALNSLSQLVLKATSPGIPDFYRGVEIWDFSVADPDNRRPVDFASRISMLQSLKTDGGVRDLLKHWPDGRLKMFATWKLLTFRREHPQLFKKGEYIPLRVEGSRAYHVIAFARRLQEEWCIVAVPRLCGSLTRAGSPPIGESVWDDTTLAVPAEVAGHGRNIFTGETVETKAVSSLFAVLPFAVVHCQIQPNREI
jgi:(1->4)-alpha-D-glucan 1-alpha-D-glucosylmutase